MPTDNPGARVPAALSSPSKGRLWTGRALSALAILFFLFDGAMKLVKPPSVIEATVRLGYAESMIAGIGIVLLAATLLYGIPQTAVLGAVLLTGYLGGAVASNVRAGTPVFNIVFPIVFGVIVWGGLWLRDERITQLLPVARKR